eukprot:629088-Pyramimonas_sp.AAC.1
MRGARQGGPSSMALSSLALGMVSQAWRSMPTPVSAACCHRGMAIPIAAMAAIFGFPKWPRDSHQRRSLGPSPPGGGTPPH